MVKISENKVFVTISRKSFAPYQPLLKKVAKEALFYLGRRRTSLEIHLVTSYAIAKLNQLYRRKKMETDVLSFGVSDVMVFSKTEPCPLGEIYLSPEYIQEQSGDIVFLTVHGMLHLLGYDHEKKSDMMKMSCIEGWLMKKLNR